MTAAGFAADAKLLDGSASQTTFSRWHHAKHQPDCIIATHALTVVNPGRPPAIVDLSGNETVVCLCSCIPHRQAPAC